MADDPCGAENKIGDDGATAFAKAISAGTKLTSLDLSPNEIGDEGARELGRAVKACSAGPCKDLKKIYLWGAPTTCTSESFCSADAGFTVHHRAA